MLPVDLPLLCIGSVVQHFLRHLRYTIYIYSYSTAVQYGIAHISRVDSRCELPSMRIHLTCMYIQLYGVCHAMYRRAACVSRYSVVDTICDIVTEMLAVCFVRLLAIVLAAGGNPNMAMAPTVVPSPRAFRT